MNDRPSKALVAGSSKGAEPAAKPERLHKLLARAGVASRREAERLIAQGRVKVNGEVVSRMGESASFDEDVIEVDGMRLAGPEVFEYYLLNKPAGVVTTVRDPQHRPTVIGLLRNVHTRVYPVGRLDADSEGLLLLTNDGELAHRLAHPRYGIEKEYEIQLDAPATEHELDRIRRGVESQGERLKPHRLRLKRDSDWRLRVVLTEGKNREVRRMFDAIGRDVEQLRRIRFGPLRLGSISPGEFRPLTKSEVERLRAATSG